MTISILKKYDALKDEQKDIRRRVGQLEHEIKKILETRVSDTVKGTRPDGTYGPIKIKGVPLPQYDEKMKQLQGRMDRYAAIDQELSGMIGEIEDFIGTVEEPQIRTFLRLKYIDGCTWREVGRRYGKGPSWAFGKVEKYFRKKS